MNHTSAKGEDTPPRAEASTPSWRQAVDNPRLVVLTLFFVTAALGLPLLWMSRGFSTLWKIVLTIAVLAWTVLILWLFWLVMAWCVPTIWQGLQDIFGT